MFKQLLKKLKLYRKTWLTNSIRVHYAQFGEDVILKELLKKNKTDGFFVDVGCYHPKKFSNTYRLYKKGWSGINIDMEADKIKLFNIARKRDINVLSPVSDCPEEVTITRYSQYGLGSTIDDQVAKDTPLPIYDQQVMQAKTLNDILADTKYHNRSIDVLSIDVEGMDYRVISSLDMSTYQPKVIIIEDHHRSIEDILKTKTYQFLTQKAYVLRAWTFYSLIFILPGADILNERESQ